MSTFTIDLCVAWARVAELVDGTFDGITRNLAVGEWRLTGAVDTVTFETGFELADVDTVRVVEDDRIVYAGYVRQVDNGVGGLEIRRTAAGDEFILTGPDEWDVLHTRVAYPTPSSGPPWPDAWDLRTGVASTAAAGYILNNAGNLATADRQIPGLTVVDGVAGLTGAWSGRLQPLDQLVARICREGGIVCRLAVDFAGAVQVTLRGPSDHTATAVLADQTDLINVQTVDTPAGATYVITGGQGTLAARTFATAGSATGAGRRETFSDQSSLSTAGEVQQSAIATLAFAAGGLTVRAEITDIAAGRLRYRDTYDIGDTIAAELDDVRYPVVVEAVTVHVDPHRAVIRPVLGDAAPNLVAGLIRDVGDLQSRFDSQIA